MSEPTLREGLRRSWQLVSQKKSLWIFGILSALIGQWGLSDFVGVLYRSAKNGFQPWDFSWISDILGAFNFSKVSVFLLSIWLLAIILLLIVSLIFIAVSARGAIIAYSVHWYKKDKILSLANAWDKGVEKFVPLLVITFLGRLSQMIIIFGFSYLALWLVRVDSFSRSFLVVVAATVALLFALIIEAVSIYSSSYVILENKKLEVAIKKGLNLFLEHVMVTLELGIILMVLSFVLVGLIIYGSFLAFIPSIIVWLLAGVTGFKFLIGFGMGTGVFLYVAFVLIVGGIFNAFVTSAWVYMFMKMHHEGVLSKVVTFFEKIFRIA